MQTLLSQTQRAKQSFKLLHQFKPIKSTKYTVRLPENTYDIEQALRLRYKVFNLELGGGSSTSYKTGLDSDGFDAFCDHLLVVENCTNEIVGTYRIQTFEIAEQGIGFYSNIEFNMDSLPGSYLRNGIELGRACIASEHRNSRVLFLLWKGIARYILLKDKRFLFGCCSLNSVNPETGWNLYSFLKEQNYLHTKYLVPVREEYQCESKIVANIEHVDIPILLKMYLKIGAKICSPPAIDREFRTIDYMILLDVKMLNNETKHLFFNDN
ncbi:GNAT family N-acetyltransferase [Gracilimonas halophila]|uniref:GNAT family N-acetyltransferase n=1 Tax=Gracilimonas halophila TaxID=1834464 RepID=A0ABW5JID5_9BACT